MDQQGDHYAEQEDAWWRELYGRSEPDTGGVAAGDSLDERFSSASAVVSPEPPRTRQRPKRPRPPTEPPPPPPPPPPVVSGPAATATAPPTAPPGLSPALSGGVPRQTKRWPRPAGDGLPVPVNPQRPGGTSPPTDDAPPAEDTGPPPRQERQERQERDAREDRDERDEREGRDERDEREGRDERDEREGRDEPYDRPEPSEPQADEPSAEAPPPPDPRTRVSPPPLPVPLDAAEASAPPPPPRAARPMGPGATAGSPPDAPAVPAEDRSEARPAAAEGGPAAPADITAVIDAIDALEAVDVTGTGGPCDTTDISEVPPPTPVHRPVPPPPVRRPLVRPRAPEFVRPRPPTYEPEPTAWPAADPGTLQDLVPDTVLDGARYGTFTLRAASVRGDSARYRGEPRRDALLTARFGSGEDALLLVAMASGARASEGAHRAAREVCEWIAGAVGRSHARLVEDLHAGRRDELKSGLHRLTDRTYGRLRVRAGDLGLGPAEYAAGLRCLLLPADARCRTRVFFGVGAGGLFRLREGAWQDLDPDPPAPGRAAEPAHGYGADSGSVDRITVDLGIPTPGTTPVVDPDEVPGEPFRFRASVAHPGDTLLLCTTGLADPLRGEPELGVRLAERWTRPEPPGLAEFLADVQLRVKGYADDRTACAVREG
ncbi:hypothetical protein GCM10010218_02850 [Streptomyces mashuensis]|uniref:PPM-type phosphatase domain-containing protein n=1 Tax=Streptomyces mashuensis TaxID=33904 RepID=A0A919E758_9ACTN|nr:protein phosphatase 2C domain-containing protein [Streptomyces mashuensis]GHF25584.1 hypothetical protein GCM10010218_02850 [Streptomyces mashuensis]